ncbi:hypothetical protein O6H91_03G102000 [Diphasiastrum complanatum]|uniref:Uncharacterized protein n=1 Tax=Diphasiastrum complanatum TaxID=34168 RepID=A0ACC2E9T7_DIPCM|nr:hypothetical protein O6H91_03G102000 [Diphasiastrum complanatum]
MHARLKLLRTLRLSSALGCHSTRGFQALLHRPWVCWEAVAAPKDHLASYSLLPFCYRISFISFSTTVRKSAVKSRTVSDAEEEASYTMPKKKASSKLAKESSAKVEDCTRALASTSSQSEGKPADLDLREVAADSLQRCGGKHQSLFDEDHIQNAEGEDKPKGMVKSSIVKIAEMKPISSKVSRAKPHRRKATREEQIPDEFSSAVKNAASEGKMASLSQFIKSSTSNLLLHDEPSPDLDLWISSALPEPKHEDRKTNSSNTCIASTVASLGEASKSMGSETAKTLTKPSLENDKNMNIEDLEVASMRKIGDDHAQMECWKLSYRQKVEKILADKGFVGDSKVLCKDSNQEAHFEHSNSQENVESNKTLSEGLPFLQSSTSGGQPLDKEGESGSISDVRGSSLNWKSEKQDFVASNDEDERDKDKDVSEAMNFYETVSEQNKTCTMDAGLGMKSAMQANALLRAALDEHCEEEGAIQSEHQRSLEVGIVGAPNSGKSTLLNFLIGTKLSAVSRKTNTTRSEILGVLTEGDTQLLFYDTPGLMLDWRGQALRQDMRNRVQSAWMTADHCELLVVLVDAHRHIEKPDPRVQRLVEKLGVEERPPQKRILCLNKVDLVKKKKSLLPLAQEFGQLPGFERIFMISGLKGGGVKDVKEFLLDQAVIRPWEEESETVTDMSPPSLAMEIVWEHVLDHLHQELPYELKHEHVSWKMLRDGSLRIEQKLLVPTEAHKKIVVGKRGENIRKIGMAAHAELNERLGKKVHLFLDVKRSSQQMFIPKYENELDDLMEM